MDDDERRKKLEAGKAKLASFQKRRSSGKSPRSKRSKTREKDSISATSPVTDEALRSVGAGDSIAVQTGSDNSNRGFSASEDSDISTTADEISTEEEASYTGGLSPRERIQELELTVSDQQVALQKLTFENKELRDREAELEETLLGRDSVIGELQKNVSQTASHVKLLQGSLSSATEAVKATDGEQNEIVDQLVEARRELKTYVDAIKRQEQAMKQIASKLEEKSMEAEEAHEMCRSLKVEMTKTRTLSSEEAEAALHSLRSELEEQHGGQIAAMKKELDRAREEALEIHEKEVEKLRETQEMSSSSAMDESDIRALRDQVSQLSLQLEAAFRSADRDKRDHDMEVVKINQRLISTIDEYEAKVQVEKETVADLENRLDMSDTVSSEIQASFSKQLQQLEEERDDLRTQMREAQSAARENASSAQIIQDLEDQVTTYKAEIEETEKQLKESNTHCRKLQDDLSRRKEEASKHEKETKRLMSEISSMHYELNAFKEKIKEKVNELNNTHEKYTVDAQALEDQYKQKMEDAIQEENKKMEECIKEARDEVRSSMEEDIQHTRDEHSDELKNLHSQHHRQMDELKNSMEKKLQGVKEALDKEKKDQLGAVKDVHEKNRDREFMLLKQNHEEEVTRINQEQEEALESLVQEHQKALEMLKERHSEEKIVEENRVRRELEEDFGSRMELLREEVRRQKDQDLELMEAELQEKHQEELNQYENEMKEKIKDSQDDVLNGEKQMWEDKLKELNENHEKDTENLKMIFEEKEKELLDQHQADLDKLKDEHKNRLEEREEEMRRLLQEQRDEQEAAIQLIKDEVLAREQNELQISEQMEALQLQLKEATVKLEKEYGDKINEQESEFLKSKEKLEQETADLKQALEAAHAERDGILDQAEESRKRLESLHHEEMLHLQEQLEEHVGEHKERVKRMQVEMESTRASRSQLQELKDELVARNASVEQVEMMRSEFNEREEKLRSEHAEELERIKNEHSNKMIELRQDMEENLSSSDEHPPENELMQQLEEYKEKLAAAQANLASISASSPLRPPSSTSEYDPVNISEMNKNYRNALTITHISDVSGIGDELEEGALHLTTEDEMIEEQLEEGELPTLEEGDLIESKESHPEEKEKDEADESSSSSSEDSFKQEEDVSQITEGEVYLGDQEMVNEAETLMRRISELENEILSMTTSHQEEIQNLISKYEDQVEDAHKESESDRLEALGKLEQQYITEQTDIAKKHEEALSQLEEERRNEITQLRLKCASDTASQVEEELQALRVTLENAQKEEMESYKHELELQTSEKLSLLEKKLEGKEAEQSAELDRLTDEHSKSTEERISAVMRELYEQKQEDLQKLSNEHQNEMKKIKEEWEKKEEERKEKESSLDDEIKRLTENLDRSKNEYQQLVSNLEAGDNDHIKLLQEQHEADIATMKRNLEEEFGKRIEKQEREFEQAQSDFVNQQQLDKFLSEREEDLKRLNEEKQEELQSLEEKYKQEVENLKSSLDDGKLVGESEAEERFREEKRMIQEQYNEELKAVATKLVEIKDERDELILHKEQLETQLQEVIKEQDQAQSELKAALIANHMEKFQGAITELDQHHLEEMEKRRLEHEEETAQYKKMAEDLIQKMKDLEEDYKSSTSALKEDKESCIQALVQEFKEKLEEEKMNHGSDIISMREAHEAQMQAIQEEHDAQLQQIEEEIKNQDVNHRGALDNLLQSQASKLNELQQQFDVALTTTRSEGDEKVQVLEQKVEELEQKFSQAENLQKELESAQSSLEQLEAHKDSTQGTEDQIKTEYEEKIAQLTNSLEKSKEKVQDMDSKILFERAEYEAEMDQLQDEIRNKDDNVKELESELEKNTEALNRLKEKFETVTTRREREGHEEDNLLRMLREDLDRINQERDQFSNANEQLLSTLTELIQSNNKCEDLIARRLQALASESNRDSALTQTDFVSNTEPVDGAAESGAHGAADGERSTSSCSKMEGSMGSFVDEGLELSQRLAESMFAGPDLDSSAREVAVGAGSRLMSAIERLLDVLKSNAEQLTVAQQAQILLGEDLDTSASKKKKKTKDEDEESSSTDADELKKIEGILAEYMNQQIQFEQKLQDQEEEKENLRIQLESLTTEYQKLEEDRNLLAKLKESFVEGREETELNLLKVTEDLATEKQAISDQYEASRMHYDKQMQQLEIVLESETKKIEEKEKENREEMEDLHIQIDALQKQLSSNTKFSTEQTSERELEREQFQQEIALLQEQLEKKQELFRSDSKLAHELSCDNSESATTASDTDSSQVSRLEEEMEARDLTHQEQLTKMQEEESKMKKTIQEYEENLQELRERESSVSELDQAKVELQETMRERDVLQQELYDNLLKVSALEAKLDHYKHTSEINGANGGAGDQSQVERLRMNLDQEREAHESKDNEIEHLVGVHSQLRSEIIEKEEEIERLLHEVEKLRELESENIELREKVKESTEVEPTRATSSRAEELSALSLQLLEEKNTEIDELQSRLSMLERPLEDGRASSSLDEENQDSLMQDLKEENTELKTQLQEAVEKLESKATLQKLELEISGQEEDLELEEEARKTATEALVTSLQETLEELRKENENLKHELESLRHGDESQKLGTISDSEIDSIPLETKEKIRHLEELLEKEKDSSGASDSSEIHPEQKEESFDGDEDPASSSSDVIREKLMEIENDLKSQPNNVLGRILAEKDSLIKQAEQEVSEQKEDICKLQKEVSSLEHDLTEPDVKVRIKKKHKNHSSTGGVNEEIDIEKDQTSSEEDDHSSSTSSSDKEEKEAIIDDEEDGMEEVSPDIHQGKEEIESGDLTMEELKILLDQQEKDLQIKDEMIENQGNILAEKEKEYDEMQSQLQEMVEKCEELQNELVQRLEEVQQQSEGMPSFSDLNEDQILQVPAVQFTIVRLTKDLEKALKSTEAEVAVSKEEKDRLMSDLSDIQREYMSLLGENREVQDLQENQAMLHDKIQDMEDLVTERETELQQAQQETDEAQARIHELMQQIEIQQQDQESDKDDNQEEMMEKNEQVNLLQQELQHKNEIVEELERQLETSNINSGAHKEEIELLQNEHQILSAENEKLLQEMEELKNAVVTLTEEVTAKQQKIEFKEKELEVINKERFIEPRSAFLLDDGSKQEENLQGSSMQEVEENIPSSQKLMREHHSVMEQMKAAYSEEISQAVKETQRQLQEEHEARLQELEAKHHKEVAELLSDSFPGESEIARKLREELDHADQLDSNLMGHLADTSTPLTSPDVDISSKLQGLMQKLHNEGVQVLSLSELQFIKHHQQQHYPPSTSSSSPPPATVEEAQQTSMRLEEDMSNLRVSWENEKLALLNAIHALKELVAQTNADNSNEPLPESEDWRGDLLRAVSDVFERERDALIAELQTTVMEVQQNIQGEVDTDQGATAAAVEKLAELEKKLKQQGMQHTSALERLVSVDRDSLLSEIRGLRNDRQRNLNQAEERIQHLESLLNSNDSANSQNIHILQSQVERLEYKLQQERALAADIQASLEAERIRTSEHMPALQRERDRSEQLDNEISRIQKKLAEETEATRNRAETLQAELDERRSHMEEVQKTLTETEKKLKEVEDAARQEKRNRDRAKVEDNNAIQDLKRSLMSEENRRDGLQRSLESERGNVARLHEELAILRADSHQEIAQQKIRCSDLEDKMGVEKRRCDDLNSALKREQETSGRLRQTLDEERDSAKEARKHDRATVADLQKILDDARKETDRLQVKMDTATRDASLAKQQLEDARAVHSDAIEAERAVRDQLQNALESVQDQKQEAQRKLHHVEDEMRRKQLSSLATNAGVPGSSDTAEGLLTNRRQLESMRQRLQLESTKLQDLTSKTAHRLPVSLPSDTMNYPQDAARVLASEMEQVDSVKRSLAEMQQELREMHTALSLPKVSKSYMHMYQDRSGVLLEPSDFNDRLLEQNAELAMLNTRHTDEKMMLRDALRRLEEEVLKARADTEEHKSDGDHKHHQQQVQEMASRMHRLYTRYLRAESFRKALVYQKKYLLLLIGGFQDCEEATLAVIARMGAYPSRDSYDRPTHRSVAFKRFRSAVRAVIAVSRLKFLVRKWQRTSNSVSASIQEKHGAAPLLNGHHHSHRRPSPSASPNLLRPMSSISAHTLGDKSPSPTPLPRYRHESYDSVPPFEPFKSALWTATQHTDTPPTKLTKPPLGPSAASYSQSGSRRRSAEAYTRSATSPYLSSYGDQPSATALRYLNGVDRPPVRPRPHSAYYPDQRTPDMSSMSNSRTQPGESDPSLNDYIQKLENLHHRLEQNPHRYQR